MWSAATFVGDYRCSENVIDVAPFLVFEFDSRREARTTIEEVESRLRSAGCEYTLHTTHGHSPDLHRLRTVILLNRMIRPSEFHRVRLGVLKHLRLADNPALDKGASSLSQGFFLPSCPPESREHFYASHSFTGLRLNVREMMALAPMASSVASSRAGKKLVARKEQQPIANEPQVKTLTRNIGGAIQVDFSGGVDQLRDALASMDPGFSRDKWFRVLAGLHDRFRGSERGFELADEFSRGDLLNPPSRPNNYRGSADVKKVWASFRLDHPKPITPGTIFDMAQGLSGVDGYAEDNLLPIVEMPRPHPYPVDQLPEVIREAVVEYLSYGQAPVALVATCALGAVSLACQHIADVQRDAAAVVPLSLFQLVLADSGERKSATDKHFLASIREFAVDKQVEMQPDVEEYRADHAGWIAEKQGVEQCIRKAIAKGQSADDWKDALRELEHTEPRAPKIPVLVRGDETIENLVSSLRKDYPSTGVMAHEGGIVFGSRSMQDMTMSTISILNALWDGHDISIGRKTSESFTLREARVTMSIQVQPDTFRLFVAQSRGLARGSGHLARFLMAQPDSTIGTRMYKEPPELQPTKRAFDERIRACLGREIEYDDESDIPRRRTLTLTDSAKARWITVHDQIEEKLGVGRMYADVKDVGAKAAENVLRVAGCFRLFEDPDATEVVDHDVTRAGNIVLWHLHEARRVLAQSDAPREVADALKLEADLVAIADDGRANRRVALRSSIRNVGNDKKFDSALLILIQRGRVSEHKTGKKKVLVIHPKVLEEYAEK
jgi:hypothetical protein